jgi:hypothetical protein
VWGSLFGLLGLETGYGDGIRGAAHTKTNRRGALMGQSFLLTLFVGELAATVCLS